MYLFNINFFYYFDSIKIYLLVNIRDGKSNLSFSNSLAKWTQHLGQSQAEARGLFQVSHVGAEAKALGPTSSVFSGTLTGTWIGSKVAGLELVPIWDAGAESSSLPCYTTMLVPTYFSFKGKGILFEFSLIMFKNYELNEASSASL